MSSESEKGAKGSRNVIGPFRITLCQPDIQDHFHRNQGIDDISLTWPPLATSGSPFRPCLHCTAITNIMLVKTSYRDVPTTANGRSGSIRIYLIEPNVPDYPEAKFPGCVVFSEIYQVTGPVERSVGQYIAAEADM